MNHYENYENDCDLKMLKIRFSLVLFDCVFLKGLFSELFVLLYGALVHGVCLTDVFRSRDHARAIADEYCKNNHEEPPLSLSLSLSHTHTHTGYIYFLSFFRRGFGPSFLNVLIHHRHVIWKAFRGQ